MITREVVFDAVSEMTPDFAAKLANCASQYAAQVRIDMNGTVLCVDSLIGILSMPLRRGVRICVCAEGAGEAEAVESVCALLTKRCE